MTQLWERQNCGGERLQLQWSILLRKVYGNESGSFRLTQQHPKSNRTAGDADFRKPFIAKTLYQHPLVLLQGWAYHHRAARGTLASHSRWASAGNSGNWCLLNCSWRLSSLEPTKQSRCLTVGKKQDKKKKNQYRDTANITMPDILRGGKGQSR